MSNSLPAILEAGAGSRIGSIGLQPIKPDWETNNP